MNDHDEDASMAWHRTEIQWSLSQLQWDVASTLDRMERNAQARTEAVLAMVVAYGFLLVVVMSR